MAIRALHLGRHSTSGAGSTYSLFLASRRCSHRRGATSSLAFKCPGDLAAFALHIADHTAEPGARPLELALNAPLLLGMGIAPGLTLDGAAHRA